MSFFSFSGKRGIKYGEITFDIHLKVVALVTPIRKAFELLDIANIARSVFRDDCNYSSVNN